MKKIYKKKDVKFDIGDVIYGIEVLSKTVTVKCEYCAGKGKIRCANGRGA